MTQDESRVLPFVPVSQINNNIDQEIADRERADAVKQMADAALQELEIDRIIKGDL